MVGDNEQHIEYTTQLRRSGFCFLPLRSGDLLASINHSEVAEQRLVETAELKAIRENLLVAKMANALQWQKEHVWWSLIFRACSDTLKAQWSPEIDDVVARARSDWLLQLSDVRGWSYRGAPDQRGSTEARLRRSNPDAHDTADRRTSFCEGAVLDVARGRCSKRA